MRAVGKAIFYNKSSVSYFQPAKHFQIKFNRNVASSDVIYCLS